MYSNNNKQLMKYFCVLWLPFTMETSLLCGFLATLINTFFKKTLKEIQRQFYLFWRESKAKHTAAKLEVLLPNGRWKTEKRRKSSCGTFFLVVKVYKHTSGRRRRVDNPTRQEYGHYYNF